MRDDVFYIVNLCYIRFMLDSVERMIQDPLKELRLDYNTNTNPFKKNRSIKKAKKQLEKESDRFERLLIIIESFAVHGFPPVAKEFNLIILDYCKKDGSPFLQNAVDTLEDKFWILKKEKTPTKIVLLETISAINKVTASIKKLVDDLSFTLQARV